MCTDTIKYGCRVFPSNNGIYYCFWLLGKLWGLLLLWWLLEIKVLHQANTLDMSSCYTLDILLQLRSFTQCPHNLTGSLSSRPILLISRLFFFFHSIARQYIPA